MKSSLLGNPHLHALEVAMRKLEITGAAGLNARLGGGPIRPVWSLLLALLALHGCMADDPLEPRHSASESMRASISDAEQGEVGTFPKAGVFQVAAGGQTEDLGGADDPAIWVHPTDRDLSLIIGAHKGVGGGVRVYTLGGTAIQFLMTGENNNVDLRYGFPLGGALVDLVSAGTQVDSTIRIYRVDPNERRLVEVGSVPVGMRPYGYAMYHSRATGEFYGFVSATSGVIKQYRFKDVGGTVEGELVRTIAVGGQVEGMVADDELGHIYLGEEDRGIWKYGAEPGAGTTRTLIDQTGTGGHLTADVEGLTLYYLRDGRGYLISSNQGANQFVIHRREGNNEYLATFTIPAGVTDAVTETDGIDVTNLGVSDAFPLGLFVAHDNSGDFTLVPWQNIANLIGLAIDTQGYDPRGGGGGGGECTAVASVEVSPASASVLEGSTLQLAAAAKDAAGNPLSGCTVTWSTTDASIAIVSASGRVTAVSETLIGSARQATITATTEGVSGNSEITVTDADPVANFTYTPAAPVVAQPVSFTDGSISPDGITSWSWDFDKDQTGSDDVSTTRNPVHMYEAPGAYTVVLTVQETDGDTHTVEKQVVVTGKPPVALYFSLGSSATVGGVSVANEDIVAFDGTVGFSVYFDGSDVGVSAFTLDAFTVISSTEILMSFTSSGSVPGAGSVDDSDIVKFTATSLGANTAGAFTLHFDASDVGLSNSDEDVDAVELLADGRLLVSTTGSFSVSGVSGADEDIIAFTPTSLGATTTGTWTLYFDGSDVELTSSDEDIDALAIDAGKVYLSTEGSFSVTGISGRDEDVFVFTPSSLGSTTQGTFASTLFFDGSQHGLGSLDITAIDLPAPPASPSAAAAFDRPVDLATSAATSTRAAPSRVSLR
jgi:myo-inositol-hexaphosphate 3-phosphohydrolase/PKD repeat protein